MSFYGGIKNLHVVYKYKTYGGIKHPHVLYLSPTAEASCCHKVFL
jgi:hypothetical protein